MNKKLLMVTLAYATACAPIFAQANIDDILTQLKQTQSEIPSNQFLQKRLFKELVDLQKQALRKNNTQANNLAQKTIEGICTGHEQLMANLEKTFGKKLTQEESNLALMLVADAFFAHIQNYETLEGLALDIYQMKKDFEAITTKLTTIASHQNNLKILKASCSSAEDKKLIATLQETIKAETKELSATYQFKYFSDSNFAHFCNWCDDHKVALYLTAATAVIITTAILGRYKYLANKKAAENRLRTEIMAAAIKALRDMDDEEIRYVRSAHQKLAEREKRKRDYERMKQLRAKNNAHLERNDLTAALNDQLATIFDETKAAKALRDEATENIHPDLASLFNEAPTMNSN